MLSITSVHRILIFILLIDDSRYNRIWTGRAAGVAVTEDGRGHITHNDICGMEWAGIDIRNGADPVVSHNVIRKGQADGIVIGEAGKSIIYDNEIQGEFEPWSGLVGAALARPTFGPKHSFSCFEKK